MSIAGAAVSVAVLALSAWHLPTPGNYVDGGAAFMAEGVMETVIRNRGLQVPYPEGCVALMRAGDLGRVVWLQRGDEVIRVEACDCAQAGHYERRVAQGDG